MFPRRSLSIALALCTGLALSNQATHAATPALQIFPSEQGLVKVETVARGLEHPWALAFLPDGQMLVTERAGRLRKISADGHVSPALKGVPNVVATGQGGLLDVVLDPDFANNKTIYLSFSEGDEKTAGTAVAKARLEGERLLDTKVIFQQLPKVPGSHHFGSRLVFGRDGNLFITTGDRNAQPLVQPLDSGQGKVHRIDTHGKAPTDNPFVRDPKAQATIWSYGHRNPQGAALHPKTGALWTVEHGARGGDEVNITRAGRNYGWPVITLGVNYNGSPIGSGKSTMPGMESPLHHWTPSIAPSGMTFYTAERFPAWRGNVFVGALALRHLARLELDGERVVHQERLLQELNERIRDVRQGPDGALYLLTDAVDGRLLRVELMPR